MTVSGDQFGRCAASSKLQAERCDAVGLTDDLMYEPHLQSAFSLSASGSGPSQFSCLLE